MVNLAFTWEWQGRTVSLFSLVSLVNFGHTYHLASRFLFPDAVTCSTIKRKTRAGPTATLQRWLAGLRINTDPKSTRCTIDNREICGRHLWGGLSKRVGAKSNRRVTVSSLNMRLMEDALEVEGPHFTLSDDEACGRQLGDRVNGLACLFDMLPIE